MTKEYKEYKKAVYREKYIEFDDAWYDDGLSYAQELVENFSKDDWLRLKEDIKSFNDATNLKVAKSLLDIYSVDSIEILLELLTLVQSIKILEEISIILSSLVRENSGITVTLTKRKHDKLQKLKKRSFILSKSIEAIRGISKKELDKIAHNANEILNYEIKKAEGLGDIYFGMTEEDFTSKYVSYELIDKGVVKIECLLDHSLHCYKFFDSVKICIEVNSGVSSIFLRNNFQGKYKDKLGLNNTYQEVKKILYELDEFGGYYEDYLLVGKDKNFLITFDFTDDKFAYSDLLEDWIDWEDDKGEEIIKECKIDYILINAKKSSSNKG